MRYTIQAKATMYNGRQYRSRLEARWAAFFDLLRVQHEYEPCDLGLWSPDFALHGVQSQVPVLVEVKPISSWDRETARKMADACGLSGEKVPIGTTLLLLGAEPDCYGDQTVLGWCAQLGPYEADWTEAILLRTDGGRNDIIDNGGWEVSLLGYGIHGSSFNAQPLWIQAANAVQWQPKR